jgi:transposase
MLGKKKIEPKLLYTVTLEDLVPEDEFYRQVDKILDLTFVYKECEKIYGKTGNPSLDPVVFFKLVLYGFLEDINKDRELIRKASDSLAARLFLGYDIDEELPWHSTISRTRNILPRALFERVFEQILQKCVKAGLVEGSHQTVDSTLVKSNSSLSSLERKSPKMEFLDYIKKTMDGNDTPPGEEEANKSEAESEGEEDQKQEKDRLGDNDQFSIIINEKKPKRKSCSNKEYVSRTDPDSKIARKPGKLTDLYYSTHYSVDSANSIITDVLTTTADKGDDDLLVEITERIIGRLKDIGLSVASIGTDKNYCSGENLRELEKLGIIPYLPSQQHPNTKGGIDRDEFEYNKEEDNYRCPGGKILSYRYTTKKGVYVYTASKSDCSSCSLKQKCSTGKQPRRVQHTIYREEYERLEKRLKTPFGKKIQRFRKIGVERLFAEAKENHGLRKYMTRGLSKAMKSSLMIAAVQNLKRLIKNEKQRSNGTMRQAITKSADLIMDTYNNLTIEHTN